MQAKRFCISWDEILLLPTLPDWMRAACRCGIEHANVGHTHRCPAGSWRWTSDLQLMPRSRKHVALLLWQLLLIVRRRLLACAARQLLLLLCVQLLRGSVRLQPRNIASSHIFAVSCGHACTGTSTSLCASLLSNVQSQLQQQIGRLKRNTATPAAGPAVKVLHKGWRLWRAARVVQEQQRRLLVRLAHVERPRRSPQP